MKNAAPYLLALLASAAYATDAAAPESFEFRLEAGKVEEVCVPLKAGEGFHFRFQSDAPLDFNVHHHIGPKVVLTTDARAVTKQIGVVTAKQANQHCMMWTAPKDRAVGVIGRWQPLGRP